MSGAQKFSLSLLISVVVFSGFAVLAWSGLFDYVETTFYLDRVRSSVQIRVERIGDQTTAFHESNLRRFSVVLNQTAVRRAFEVNQARDDIVQRNTFFDALQAELPSLDYVRFVDVGGARLHFSTRADDYTESGTTRIYTPLVTLDAGEPLPISALAYEAGVDSEDAGRLVGQGIPEPDIVIAPARNQLIYRIPILDEFDILQGAALFYVNVGGLSTWLVREGLTGAADEIVLIGSDPDEDISGGLLVNTRREWNDTLLPLVIADWKAVMEQDRPVLAATDDASFAVFSALPASGPAPQYAVIYLFPESDLEMTDIMRIVLLAAIFLTVFLVVFLLFNLRQDAVVVLSDRVKRFQISLLREFMENKEDLDFQRWRAELEDRRAEVANRIRRGIGRVRSSQREEVDKLIDNSWDEILDVLGSRATQSAGRGVDLDRLEDIVERVIGNLQATGAPAVEGARRPLGVPSEPAATAAPAAGEVAPAAELGEPIEVEELSEAELSEAESLEELSEPEDIEGLEEMGEVVSEDISESSEPVGATGTSLRFGEPIDVEELSEEEFEAAEAVEELEELEEPAELEQPEEIETVAEPESVEGLETPVETATAESEVVEQPTISTGSVDELASLGEPIEVEELTEEEFAAAEGVEELSELEVLEAPEEIEELEELEELEDLEDADVTAEPEPIDVAGEIVEAEEVSEVEDLADLEALDEVEDAGDATDVGDLAGAEAVDGISEPEAREVLESAVEVDRPDEEMVGELEPLEEVEAEEVVEELEESETTVPGELVGEVEEEPGEPSRAIDELDEESELQWYAAEEGLDVDDVSLEKLDHEGVESLARLEEESIEEVEETLEAAEPLNLADAEHFVAPGAEPAQDEAPSEEIEELDEVEEPAPPTVGDLEWARSGDTPFRAGTFSFGKGTEVSVPMEDEPVFDVESIEDEEPAEELESLESAEELALPTTVASEETPTSEPEVAELEAADEPEPVAVEPIAEEPELIPLAEEAEGLEEMPAASAAVAPLVSEPAIRFTDLRSMSTPEYEIASIGEILDRLHIDKGVIVDRDGLVEVDAQAMAARRASGEDETRQLIESVIGEEPEDVMSGVEELFGGDASDLFADLSPGESSMPLGQDRPSSIVRFLEDSFDYDAFLRGFNESEGGVIKSLVTFTRYWNARVGLLLGGGEGELTPRYGLGIEEPCQQALRISHASGIYRNVLQKRLVLYVNRPLRRVEYFLGLCSDDQMAYFQKALFVPIVLHGEPGYALLGLSEDVQSLEHAFQSVVPLLASITPVG